MRNHDDSLQEYCKIISILSCMRLMMSSLIRIFMKDPASGVKSFKKLAKIVDASSLI